jgi:hypothetical protein
MLRAGSLSLWLTSPRMMLSLLAETADGVLIEWVNTGTLHGAPFELRGADRFTLRDGKAPEGFPISIRGRSSNGDPEPDAGVASGESRS